MAQRLGRLATKTGEKCGLGLPFTHKSGFLQKRKPQAHELKLCISPPKKLVTGRRVVVSAEVSSDLCNQLDRFTQ